jgi:hypothetical protein
VKTRTLAFLTTLTVYSHWDGFSVCVGRLQVYLWLSPSMWGWSGVNGRDPRSAAYLVECGPVDFGWIK